MAKKGVKSGYIYRFTRHCLSDPEFNVGGIPTNEGYYLQKLGLQVNDPDLSKFYGALYTLYELNRKYSK